MKIPVKLLDKLTILYLSIPLILFFIFWLKLIFSVIAISALIIIIFYIFKHINHNKDILEIGFSEFMIILFICFLVCIISGIGNLYYQSLPDWNIKNAVMHDLVNFHWPVIYDNGVGLVYYFGFFLPSAFVGKIFSFCGAETSFFITNIFSVIWAGTGLFFVILNIFIYTACSNIKRKFTALVIFLFFSGLDILYPASPEFLHIEWHSGDFQYSSIITLMVWAYNQAVAPWLLTILFLRKCKDIQFFGIIGTAALFYAPLPFIGLVFYLISVTVIEFVKRKKETLRKIFDIKNILSVFVILPVFYLFYSSNYTAINRSVRFIGCSFDTIIFLIFESLIFILILWKKYYNDTIFLLTAVSLITIPLFELTNCLDFCMRASVPAIFILAVMVIKFICDVSEDNLHKNLKKLLIIILIFGAITPSVELFRGFYQTFIFKEKQLVKDSVKTLNNKITADSAWIEDIGDYKNYGCLDMNKSIFFKKLSR